MDEKIKKIVLPIKNNLEIFEKKLNDIIEENSNPLNNHLHEFMFQSAKRLRAIFVFLFAEILNIKDEIIFDIALLSELIHSASLVHDDIIDESNKRRSIETFNSKFNSKIAVLEGDLLLAIALEVLSKTNLEIVNIYSKRIKKTILGEISQNISTNIDINTYLDKTFNKTGNLFVVGLEALFSLKKQDEILKQNLLDFIKNYSVAFQLKNDISDIKSKKFSDAKHKNYTLPLILFAIENKINLMDFEKYLSFDFNKYILQSEQYLEQYTKKALKNIQQIENNCYKQALIELTQYTLRS